MKFVAVKVDEEGLLTAFNEADKHNWKREELIAYDNVSMRIQDAKGERELAEEQGREKEKEAVTIEMHKEGFPIDVISKVTKLPFHKLQQIVEEYEKNKK